MSADASKVPGATGAAIRRQAIGHLCAGLLSGLVFGLGLAIAGMADPRKVLAFLDVAGAWDPSLLLVLGAAATVAMVGFRWVLSRPAPLFDDAFHLPPRGCIDAPLLTGTALFGIGWGLAGYCPGPAIASLAFANPEAATFLPALLAGQLLYRWQAARC